MRPRAGKLDRTDLKLLPSIPTVVEDSAFIGFLRGVADYPVATTVLLKIHNGSDTDDYVNFNSQQGIN